MVHRTKRLWARVLVSSVVGVTWGWAWAQESMPAPVSVPAATLPSARPAPPAATQPTSLLPANWQQLSVGDLAAVCAPLANGGGDHPADRAKLAPYVFTTYLSKAPALTGATPDQVMTLLMVTTPQLNDRQRAVVRGTLFQRFPANGQDVQSLSLKKVAWLTGTAGDQLLIPPSQCQTWVQSWLDGQHGGADLSLADALDAGDMIVRAYDHKLKPMPASLQNLVQTVVQNTHGWDQTADVKTALGYFTRLQGWTTDDQRLTLRQYIWGRINGNMAQAASQLDWTSITLVKGQILPGLKLTTRDITPLIAGFLTTQASTLTPDNLADATVVISELRHDPKLEGVCTTAYQAVAQTIITRLTAADLVSDQVGRQEGPLAMTFETDAQRQQLRDIVAAGGTPLNRLDAGKILACACKNAGQLPDFKKEAAGHVADPQLDGDGKALWLLMAGEAEKVTPEEPEIKRKRPWMDQAFAAAQSEGMRLLIVEEYAIYFNSVGYPHLGVSLLGSVAGQFKGAAAARVQTLKTNLEHSQVNLQAAIQAHDQAAAKVTQVALLKHYQESLQRAQMDRDQVAAARLQGAISDLQSKIEQAKPAGQ